MREDGAREWLYSRVAGRGGVVTAHGMTVSTTRPARPGRPFPLVVHDELLLDPPDPKLDYLTRLAVDTAGADVGGISLLFQSQIWLPSRFGIDERVMPRASSFCNRALEEGAPWFEVRDARGDPRFVDNPLVARPPHYRHYAAAPLKSPRHRLRGTLWVMSRQPRLLDCEQASRLTLLARIVTDMLELRYCDPTTGMFNRSVFLHHLSRLLAQEAGMVTAGFIDLVGFRQMNGMFGRAAGDRILRAVGQRLEEWGGDSTLLGHLGGDRFAFALSTGPERHDARIERLRALIDQPIDLGEGFAQTLHARIGVQRQHTPYKGDPAEVLDAAETAASTIARHISASVACEYDSALLERTRLRYELRDAIRGEGRHGSLEVHYQPQIDVAAGRLIGLEALVRWRHPEFGLVGPGMFVPQAETSGRIIELDLHVLELVCRDLSEWRAKGVELAPVSLNFSRVSLAHGDVFGRLGEVLERTGTPGSLLELEVTESVLLDSLQPLHARIAALRGLGVRIAVDDFGTGSSNLDALANFHFDRLKVDRQFVHGVAGDRKKAGLFALIQGIAKVFHAELVCEGLEDEADLDWLRGQGAHCVQGWLFSRARPAADIECMLSRFREARGRTLALAELKALLA